LDPRNDPPRDAARLRLNEDIMHWLDANDPDWFYRETVSPAPEHHPVFKKFTWYPDGITPKEYCDIHVSSLGVVTAFKLVWSSIDEI
jgi:hypothetical protein